MERKTNRDNRARRLKDTPFVECLEAIDADEDFVTTLLAMSPKELHLKDPLNPKRSKVELKKYCTDKVKRKVLEVESNDLGDKVIDRIALILESIEVDTIDSMKDTHAYILHQAILKLREKLKRVSNYNDPDSEA